MTKATHQMIYGTKNKIYLLSDLVSSKLYMEGLEQKDRKIVSSCDSTQGALSSGEIPQC